MGKMFFNEQSPVKLFNKHNGKFRQYKKYKHLDFVFGGGAINQI